MYERLLEEYEKRKVKKTRRITNTKSYTKIFKNFIMNYTEKKIDNPKLQAEFSYSLIQGDTYE